MRGIFLTGVLQAFWDRGYRPFKLIIGSSAGAITGTAYSAGKIHLARDAYFTKLLTAEFIHFSNVLNYHKNVLDLDWMIKTILSEENPFDSKTLRKSIPVLITATHCAEYNPPKTVYLNSKNDDIETALKATAAIPFLYRGFVNYRDFSLLDGGLLDPVPYQKALSMGFKQEDILVIVTRVKGYRKKEESFWIKTLYESYYKNPKYRLLVQVMENRYIRYNTILNDLEDKFQNINVIYPPDDFIVNRLTQDQKKVLEGFEQGIDSGKRFLQSH